MRMSEHVQLKTLGGSRQQIVHAPTSFLFVRRVQMFMIEQQIVHLLILFSLF